MVVMLMPKPLRGTPFDKAELNRLLLSFDLRVRVGDGKFSDEPCLYPLIALLNGSVSAAYGDQTPTDLRWRIKQLKAVLDDIDSRIVNVLA